MADGQTSFRGRGHSTQDAQRLSQKVSERWHLIKAENRAYDLSGQGHRQENEDSLFLIGQPAPDIIKEKISERKKSENERWHVLSRMAPEASWVNSLFDHFDTEWQWQTETHGGEILLKFLELLGEKKVAVAEL